VPAYRNGYVGDDTLAEYRLAAVPLQMTVFLETEMAPEWVVQASTHERNHVDEDEDDLELGHLCDRRTVGCRRILPGYSRTAQAGLIEKPRPGRDAT
jgi:hypothetical protein